MQQFEKHFHARMVAVENDARAAARFVYTDRTFNHQVAIDPDIYAAINRHAGFWRVIAASLQTSTFITLGRLYDDKGTRNIAELLEYSNEHIGIFSHATFIARKMTGSQSKEAAENSVAGNHEVSRSDFVPWKNELDEVTAIYRADFRPIRHRVFAHSADITGEQLHTLFSAALIDKLQRITIFPLRLCKELWHAYTNGTRVAATSAPTTLDEVLEYIPLGRLATWDHVHAADDTVALTRSLGRK